MVNGEMRNMKSVKPMAGGGGTSTPFGDLTRGCRRGGFVLRSSSISVRPPSVIVRSSPPRPAVRRPGLILVVVLVMVVLLALLAASYSFMAHADLSTVLAGHYRFQARMAAESGVQRAIVMLRGDPEDTNFVADLDLWFDNPEEFYGAIVYGVEGETGAESFREREEADLQEDVGYDPQADPIWRFNLIAVDYDEPGRARYGITDECARLDLNMATESQLRSLFELVIPEDADNEVDIDVLVESLLDWREPGQHPRPSGAKEEYYQTLDPPYRCKAGSFSTVEELLLVKGFTGWVLFGEDFNRNGLLDPNEDDDEASFPSDNADGELFPGIAPFLTIWSRELNTSNDNRARINLNMQDLEKLQEKLEEHLDSNLISYVMDVRAGGMTFNSVMNLIPAPPEPEEEEEELEQGAPTGSVQPEQGKSSSSADSEKPKEPESGLSDLDQSEGQSENAPAGPRPVYSNLTAEDPPGSYEDLPLILDRLTVAAVPAFLGRINVSTAPREVLAMIEEISDAELDAIVAARRELTGVEKATPAWLLTQNVLDEYTFRRILDKITTASSVYRIESVGYADHLGVVERLNVVIEMRGPIAQVLYYRNLDGLGPAYTPHAEERRELKNRSG